MWAFKCLGLGGVLPTSTCQGTNQAKPVEANNNASKREGKPFRGGRANDQTKPKPTPPPQKKGLDDYDGDDADREEEE